MDVKGGVHNLRELEEVGISGVGSTASKDSLQKVGEFSKGPWLVRENEITVTLDVHLVVEDDLPRLVVVVDVLLWCLPVLQDVVVVSVVDDQDASGLQHVIHVLYAPLMIPEISVIVHEMRK